MQWVCGHCGQCECVCVCVSGRTQHGDVGVGFLRGVCVQLAHVAALVRQRHVGQRHPQLILREVHQLEARIFQG